MNSIKYAIIVLWTTLISFSCSASDALETPLLINCGLARSSESVSSFDNRVWQSDDDPAFAQHNIDAVSTTVTTDPYAQPPFKVGRLISSPINYKFPISPGPYFLRLYFSTTIFNNPIPSYQFSTSLLVNNFTLLRNFNPFLNSPNKTTLLCEFQIIVINVENHLNLTFSPGDHDNVNTTQTSSSPYGYVNGIEICSIPDGWYIKTSTQYNSVCHPDTGYTIDKGSSAFQTMYRLNVGGLYVDARDDSPGGMNRTWETDDAYLFTDFSTVRVLPVRLNDVDYLEINYTKKTPEYVAPKQVYGSARRMGDNPPAFNLARNLTWIFDVDPGFDYLVRLLFREMDKSVTGTLQMMFEVYLGGLKASPAIDIWAESGGLGIPFYKDYVISLYNYDAAGKTNDSKVPLSIDLHPIGFLIADVLLNGLEILKLSANGNLAIPNPPCNVSCTTPELNQTPTRKTSLLIIGSIFGVVVLIAVILLALYRHRLLFQLKSCLGTSAINSSGPSLPSARCRRFSLAEIRSATSNFDENTVIGIGGFGKVYKGCIDNGATNVAIKRLNPSSKQGAHEFFTKIRVAFQTSSCSFSVLDRVLCRTG